MNNKKTILTGGCLCGAIRYECHAEPIVSAYCYCSDCRHLSGGPPATFLLVPKEALSFTGIEMKGFTVKSERGASLTRRFCPKCGTALSSYFDQPDSIATIKIGTLDDPEKYPPSLNCWTKSAPKWAVLDESLISFDKNPPDDLNF